MRGSNWQKGLRCPINFFRVEVLPLGVGIRFSLQRTSGGASLIEDCEDRSIFVTEEESADEQITLDLAATADTDGFGRAKCEDSVARGEHARQDGCRLKACATTSITERKQAGDFGRGRRFGLLDSRYAVLSGSSLPLRENHDRHTCLFGDAND